MGDQTLDKASFTPDAMEAQLMSQAMVGKPAPTETPAADAPPAAPAPEAPLYRGFLGDLKNVDDLKNYAKNLEEIVVQARAMQSAPPNNPITPQAPPTPAGPSMEDQIQEVWFSDPKKAASLLRQQVKSEYEVERSAERNRERFWQDFYEKNPDLKRVERIVQSVVKEKLPEIQKLPSDREVSEFLSKETRDIIGLVGKAFSKTETRLPSEPAVSFGASGETPPAPAAPLARPLSFIEQIRKARPGGKK
jgi:hypothetical protein